MAYSAKNVHCNFLGHCYHNHLPHKRYHQLLLAWLARLVAGSSALVFEFLVSKITPNHAYIKRARDDRRGRMAAMRK